jgi:uncharacterized protein (DUF1697 family)
MEKYISILRGINVSGHKKILMADLIKLYESIGLSNPASYIQSGNVVFTADKKKSPEALSKTIEAAILKRYEFEVPVLVIPDHEFKKIIVENPFLIRDLDKDKLHVTFLAAEPSLQELENIKKYNYPPDEFFILKKAIYIYCPNGYGNSKLSNTFFESKLKQKATTRNWKTICHLANIF